MSREINCKNCGAPLHYENNLAICSYCGTEYHIDCDGRIEEYNVTLNVLGENKQFYISNIERLYPEFGFEFEYQLRNVKRTIM